MTSFPNASGLGFPLPSPSLFLSSFVAVVKCKMEYLYVLSTNNVNLEGLADDGTT